MDCRATPIVMSLKASVTAWPVIRLVAAAISMSLAISRAGMFMSSALPDAATRSASATSPREARLSSSSMRRELVPAAPARFSKPAACFSSFAPASTMSTAWPIVL